MRLICQRLRAVAFCATSLALTVAAGANVIVLDPTKDTTLFENNPSNNLGGEDLAVGATAQGKRMRPLFFFDVAGAVPSGATIDAVSLIFFVTRNPYLGLIPSTVGLHEALVDWTEGTGNDASGNNGVAALPGESTWNSRAHGSVAWGVAGGQAGVDYVAVASGTGAMNAPGEYTIPSTAALVADVQSWLDNPAGNFGYFMISANEATAGNGRRFASTENLDQLQSPVPVATPRLQITYTVPEPGSSALLGVSGLLALCGRGRGVSSRKQTPSI